MFENVLRLWDTVVGISAVTSQLRSGCIFEVNPPVVPTSRSLVQIKFGMCKMNSFQIKINLQKQSQRASNAL